MNTKETRFEVIYKEGHGALSAFKKILRDNETGIQYLVIESGYGVALTPLLDKEGKPTVDPKFKF